MWSDYQRKNRTPVLPFEGIIDVIRAFAAVPQGICSQNSADNIKGLLDKERIAPLFRAVVGYEDELESSASSTETCCCLLAIWIALPIVNDSLLLAADTPPQSERQRTKAASHSEDCWSASVSSGTSALSCCGKRNSSGI